MRPQSVSEIGDIVRHAVAEGQAIYPLGGRTLLDIGFTPTRSGIAVDLRSLSQVLDYPARDMTITVQSGITLAQLQSLLATENQRLPIDVPKAGQTTVGGMLATNITGPRRLCFGTLRDYVIGISTINDHGQEVKAGGRVVKNVAGYDLCKLHIGALGTLGIISQVTLKLRPLPECTSLVTFGCETAALDRLLDDLHASRTRPICLDLLNQETVRFLVRECKINLPDAPWVIVVGFEDNADDVGWQVRQLIHELAPGSIQGLEARAGAACDPLWRGLVEHTASGRRLTLKANLLPSAVSAFCRQLESLSESVRVQAHAGSGIVYGLLDGDLTLPRFAAMLKELTDTAVRAEGNLIVPRCPSEWKRELPVWGRERGDHWLMRQVKEKMDPQHLFNPGRFLAGI